MTRRLAFASLLIACFAVPANAQKDTPPSTSQLSWETIGKVEANRQTSRAKIDGGWLYMVQSTNGVALTFVPDVHVRHSRRVVLIRIARTSRNHGGRGDVPIRWTRKRRPKRDRVIIPHKRPAPRKSRATSSGGRPRAEKLGHDENANRPQHSTAADQVS